MISLSTRVLEYYIIQEWFTNQIGTSGCLPSAEHYGQCLNISEGRRSDVDNKPCITLAMGTYWLKGSRIDVETIYQKNPSPKGERRFIPGHKARGFLDKGFIKIIEVM